MNEVECKTFKSGLDQLIEGNLDEAGRIRLGEHAAACDDCRHEWEWFNEIEMGLGAIGDALASDLPEINIIDSVLAAVGEARGPKIVPFEAPKIRTRTFPIRALAGMAAAAAVAIFVWTYSDKSELNTTSEVPSLQAKNETPRVSESVPASATSDPTQAFTPTGKPGEIDRLAPPPARVRPVSRVADQELGLSRESVLASYRESLRGGDTLDDLLEWARLKEEQALNLASNEDTPTSVLIGAAQSLSGEEATTALLTAIGRMPEDPYLRYRLAMAYESDGIGSDALTAYDALADLDSENGLGYYGRALELLRQDSPNLAAAMDALTLAGSFESASAYGLEAARYREEALIANGTDPDVARMLSAFSAGQFENAEITGMAAEMMEMGRLYEDSGDTTTAIAIYRAVLDLGQQLDVGADLTQERLAALEIQQTAVDALQPILLALNASEESEALEAESNALVASIEVLGDYIQNLDLLFAGDIDSMLLILITNLILEAGDLNIFEIIADLL